MGNTCDRWLGCCCLGGGEAKEASLQFVPSSRRNCTDVLFFLLYVASWVGLVAILIISVHRGGTPQRILHGQNYNGSICGIDVPVKDQPYAAWVAMPQSSASVDQCSDCVEILTCLRDCNETLTSPLMIDHYPSEKFMYYCVPKLNNALNFTFAFSDQFNSASMLASRAFTDLYTVWPVILVSAFVAILFSFIYAWLSKRFAGVLILASILLVTTGGFLISYALLRQAKEADDTYVSDRSRALRALGIALAVLTLVFLLIIIALRKRIYIAIEVVKESSRAVLDLASMIVFPLMPFVLGCGYFVLFIVITVYIGSVWTNTNTQLPPYIASANVLPQSYYVAHDWDQSLKNAFAYVFFHLLWSVQFLIYFTFMVIAGTVSQWYFTPRDPTTQQKIRNSEEGRLGYFPVLASIGRTMRFHLGTVAFAALIIAIIQFIRAVVKYIEQTTTPKDGPANRLQKALYCCLQCCLGCIQWILDKVSKNALIWSSIYGDSFTSSCCSSFALIWANLARVAALTLVGPFIMRIGKFFVAFLTTGAAMIAAYKIYNTELNSLVVPMVTIFILSYLVSSLFMSLLDTTMSTIFLCFLIDEKFNKGSNTMLASEGLQKLVLDHRELSEKLAHREQQRKAWWSGAGHDAVSGNQFAPAGTQNQQVAAVPTMPTRPGAAAAIQLSTAPNNFI